MASVDEMGSSEVSDSLEDLLAAAGEEAIHLYRQKYLAPALLKACPKRYSIENAASWVNFDKFASFVADHSQNAEPHTPSENRSICSDSNLASSPVANNPNLSKRSRSTSASSAESPTARLGHRLVSKTKKPAPKRLKKAEGAEPIMVTRKCFVEEVKILTEPPENWVIPSATEKSVAYILDLSNSCYEYKNEKGELNPMSKIIKNHCTDGWEGGTGGSKKNPVSVDLLGGVSCVRAIHTCRGTFICSEAEPNLWQNYTRYGFDFEPFKKMAELNKENNASDQDTPLGIAASFYHGIKYAECRANGNCNGQPMLRRLQTPSFHGKNFVVSCSAWKIEDGKHSHFSRAVPSNVQEDILQDLFAMGGVASPDLEKYSKPCGYIVAPRVGFRQKHCPHVHFRNGKQVIGSIQHHKCPAGIIIFTPVDQSIRKAVIIPLAQTPHNHPSFKPDKLTLAAKETWLKAVQTAGALGSTVSSIDKAPSTSVILGPKQTSREFQGLVNSRYKSSILGKEKCKNYPHGLQFEGVTHLHATEYSKHQLKDRYIHSIISEPCAETGAPIHVIVTMFPTLANFVHNTRATLHDNTYKRVHGDFNEWEVVIWDSRLNKRISISRVYCNRETRQAFRLIWRGWMDAIRTVTGKPLLIKAFHGEGQHVAFLMDGCAAQVQGLGDHLLTLNDPSKSGISTSDPDELVQYVIRTCDVHCNRNLDALGSVCSYEDMSRIRQFRFLATQEEKDSFVDFCKNHPEKKVRDWVDNKLKYPWYLPSLCQHLSKIRREDWGLTPADTNLNESSHPATNRATGINLPLVEAIETARQYDQLVAFDVLKAEETCVEARARNTLMHRFKSNGQRTNARIKRADQEHEIRTKLCALDNTLEVAEKEKKAAIEKVKTLKAEKKQVSGGKRRKYRTAGTRKPFPAFEPTLSASSKENVLLSSTLLTSTPGTVSVDLVPPLPPSPPHYPSAPNTILFEARNQAYPTQNNPFEDPFLLPPSSSSLNHGANNNNSHSNTNPATYATYAHHHYATNRPARLDGWMPRQWNLNGLGR